MTRVLPIVQPPETTTTVVAFKPSARVPAGVTAEGLTAEIESICTVHGVASIDAIKTAIQASPEEYPNIVAWLPKDEESAWNIAIAECIRRATRSLIRYTVTVSGDEEVKSDPIRLFFSVTDKESGERGYQRIETIARQPDKVLQLYNELEAERASFFQKERRVQAEIKELLQLRLVP